MKTETERGTQRGVGERDTEPPKEKKGIEQRKGGASQNNQEHVQESRHCCFVQLHLKVIPSPPGWTVLGKGYLLEGE